MSDECRKASSLPTALKKCRSIKDLMKKDQKKLTIFDDNDACSQAVITQNSSIDDNALPKLYDTLMRKQRQIEIEIVSLQKSLLRSQQDKQRLEDERCKILSLYKEQQEELNEMQVQHETDSETIRSLKTDLDKLYLSFKNYRESKEKELQNLTSQKAKFEALLTRVNCENACDRRSFTAFDDSLPDDSAHKSGSADWLASSDLELSALNAGKNILDPAEVLQKVLKNVSFLSQLGMLHCYRGNLDIALDMLHKSLQAKEVLLGSNDCPELTKELQNLACVLIQKKEWKEAEQILNRFLNVKLKHNSADENSVREVKLSLANVYLRTDRLSLAQPLLEEVVADWKSNSAFTYPLKMASVLCNLAAVHCQQGALDEAEVILEEVLSMEQLDSLAGGQKIASKARKILAKLHLDKGNAEYAAILFMQSSSSSGGSQSSSRKSSASTVQQGAPLSLLDLKIRHKSLLAVPGAQLGSVPKSLIAPRDNFLRSSVAADFQPRSSSADHLNN